MIRGLNYCLKLKCYVMLGEGSTSKDMVISLEHTYALKTHNALENNGLWEVPCFWKLSGTNAWHGRGWHSNSASATVSHRVHRRRAEPPE